MASTLKVDNIIATDGTTAPITLSGDAATLGSAVTFPAGLPYSIKVYEETTDSGNTTTTGIGFGTVRTVSLDSNENVLIRINGGYIYHNGGCRIYSGIQYDTSTLSSNTQGTIKYNRVDSENSTSGINYNIFGYYELLYTAGSNTTLYYRPAVGNNNGRTVNWVGSTSESSIKITEIKFT